MAKKSNNGEGTGKSKKRTVTHSAKHVAKPKQAKSTASRKLPTTPKQTSLPRSQKVAGGKPQNDGDERFVVYGQVLYADKKPAMDVKVIAFDQDIAHEDLLGKATTDRTTIIRSGLMLKGFSIAGKAGGFVVRRHNLNINMTI